MQGFIIVAFLIVTLGEYVVGLTNLPPALRFLPEGMSAVAVLYVIFAGTRDRFRLVALKYWVAYGSLCVVMLCGIVNSPSGPGPMLSGARFFLRAVPFFFIPAVLPISDKQLKRQLMVLLAVGLLQIPISMYQRWLILDAGRYSGDDVRGTLMDSGILSMFEICAVMIFTGLLLKGRIRRLTYAAFFFLLLIPTAIDETKVTVVFLPMGLLATIVMGSAPQKRVQYVSLAFLGLLVFATLFVPVYNKMEEFNPYKGQKDITNYFTDRKNLNRYMSSNLNGVTSKEDVRRGDAIIVPLQFIAKDPVTLAFGLGLGSVSPPMLGKGFDGPYFGLFQKFIITSFTYFVLQVGIFGVLIIAYLFFMVFLDSLTVARHDDTLVASIAAGWSGVVAIFFVGMLYNVFHDFTSMTYLYAYFAGLICARCAALKQGYAVAAASPRYA